MLDDNLSHLPGTAPSPFGSAPEPVAAPAWPLPAEPRHPAIRGLTTWLIMLVVFGVGGLLLRQEELAMLAAMAGLFVASQAADLDAQWQVLHYLVSWVVPLGGAATFTALGFILHPDGMTTAASRGLDALCFASAFVCLLASTRPFANALVRYWFRGEPPSHTLRLSARIVLTVLLFVLPGWFAVRNLLEQMGGDMGSLVEGTSLGTGLIGYVLLALAAVGFLLHRGARETLERLGVGRPTAKHLLVAGVGVACLFAFNSGADWVQRTFLHDLWLADQQMNEAIGGHLSFGETVVLGLSAGIGEEITMRGALQPRLGLFWTSALFAGLHVQYSWFGMLAILALGLILGTIRRRTNTTVAMIVHGLYDIAAVLTLPRPT